MSRWSRFRQETGSRWLGWKLKRGLAPRGRTSTIERDRNDRIYGWIDPKQKPSGPTQAAETKARVTLSLRVYRAATNTWEDEVTVLDERTVVPPHILAALQAAAEQQEQ